tara:strand:- start:828 stop:1844 length:1017 start_codon:yes stop_codon:yes gene_type:complete
MSKWNIFNGTDDEWDHNMILQNAHYRQSTIWSNLKNKKNWEIIRLVNDRKNKTSVQVIYKRYYFITFFFIAGGAIGSIENLNKSFIKFLTSYTKSKIHYIRLDDGSYEEKNLEYLENSTLWNRPIFRMNESKCAFYNLSHIVNKKTIFAEASGDFKSSLKNCDKKNLKYVYTHTPSSEDLSEISISMYRKKKLKMMEFDDFENFKQTLGNNMHYVVAYDQDNNPLAYRAVLIFNDKAWDIAAATSLKGRKTFAGFGVFREIMYILINRSIKEFNLGALTSKSGGVNSFKIGTGAKERFYVGEFENSNLIFLKGIVNLLISISLSKSFITFNFLRRLYF